MKQTDKVMFPVLGPEEGIDSRDEVVEHLTGAANRRVDGAIHRDSERQTLGWGDPRGMGFRAGLRVFREEAPGSSRDGPAPG